MGMQFKKINYNSNSKTVRIIIRKILYKKANLVKVLLKGCIWGKPQVRSVSFLTI